jgi:predicted RNA-binding Zn ribbon-like protein
MAARQAAPPPLDIVEDFVNTLSHHGEALATPAALAGWLAGRGLAQRSVRASKDDVARAQAVREALRALMRTNNGAAIDDEQVRVLNAFSARVPFVAEFAPSGTAALAPVGNGADAALARLLRIVLGAMADGTWTRMKACRADTCRWAFYDSSKNHSAAWCSMQVCGNRAKARGYRRRQAAG